MLAAGAPRVDSIRATYFQVRAGVLSPFRGFFYVLDLRHAYCYSHIYISLAAFFKKYLVMANRPRFSSVIDARAVLAWLVVALVALVAFKSIAQTGKQPRPAALPAYSFVGVDGQAVSNAQLAKAVPTVVVFFDPDCDHCQRQAQWIRASESLFGRTQFLWVSTAELNAIKAFSPKYLAGAKLKHTFAKDAKYQFDSWFGYSVAPTVLAFDAAGKLVKTWSNEVAADEIAAALK